MSFILAKREDVIMVKFDDLREQYINFCNERTKYWNNLSREATKLAQGFYEYLDIKGRSYKDSQGEDHSYMQIGVVDSNGKFKETRSYNNGDNLDVEFSIKLTIDRDEKTFPKDSLIISLSLKKEKDNYIASFLNNSGDKNNFDVTNDKDMVYFYDAIAANIASMFDTRKF